MMKNNIRKYTASLFLLVLVIAGIGCNKLNDEFDSLLNNPNLPTTEAADANLYLNQILLSFNGFHRNASDLADPLVRQETMFATTYKNAYSAASFDGIWTNGYTSIIKTADVLIPLAESKQLYIHSGIAKILKAYTIMTMVDLFGNIPYAEANLGVNNLNPKQDEGAAVYAAGLSLLDSAIATLQLDAAATPTNDVYFRGSAAKWITLAKTLKMRAYVQTRLVDNTAKDKINAVLADGDIIATSGQDFVFQYGTKAAAPDSRDGRYTGNYATGNGTASYLGTYAMWVCAEEKGFVDPRTYYYFYRQITHPTDYSDTRVSDQTTLQFALACYFRQPPVQYPPTAPYCVLAGGWWGRDHGNNEGTGPDALLKSTWGVYPAAGALDYGQDISVGLSQGLEPGAGGAGIEPIWLNSFTYFLEAEAALTLGTTGNVRSLLEQAIRASFAKVSAFPASIGYNPTSDTAYLITDTKVNSYVKYVLGKYDVASADDKLNIIEKEYYIASWGNGLEPYNNYRRTAKPDNFQLTVNSNPGYFIRSFYYPGVYVNYNLNAQQKTDTNVKVFWDTNPDALYY